MADRRALAIQLHKQGVRTKDIIRRTGAAESTVGKWLRQYRKMVEGAHEAKNQDRG
jgi:transposase